MLRRKIVVLAMTLGVLAIGTGVAQAWDTIAHKSGHGSVTLRSWTRNYNQVAFVADHAGTRVHVSISVSCKNGDHYDNTWVDGGKRFRFILGGLGNSGTCNETFKVVAAKSYPTLYLLVAARG